jgi:hypothetical protein
MGLLNLTLLEFLAILGPVTAAVVAMYLYDRARRRQIVSTLRFFRRQAQAPVFARRKKIQQPWSLLLQLVSLLLLLLAIAELTIGRTGQTARDHVLILDTSAWMGSLLNDGQTPLMEVARRRALDYLRAVPREDRVLLVRGDALATPVTTFTGDRAQLERAIRGSQAGATALNLSAAVDYARSVQRMSSARPGEIAIVSGGRVTAGDPERLEAVDHGNLRSILIAQDPEDCGIRRLSARRSAIDALEWEIDVGVHNYGGQERTVPVRLSFAGSNSGTRTLLVPPRGSAEASFRLRTSQAGVLEAVIDSRDSYRANNRAAVELPLLAPLRIQVFTAHPELWQPLLTASRFLAPEFRAPSQYTPDGPAGRLVILDGFRPAAPPDTHAVWIVPSGPVNQQKASIRRWSEHALTAGLHNRDIETSHATILQPGAGEVVIAESETGPVLTASEGDHKQVRFGFHPLQEGVENHLAIPLLFANLAQWISPDTFRLSEIRAASPGLIELAAASGTRPEEVKVSSPQIRDLVATLNEDRLRLFTNRAGTVRVTLPEREVVYSLTLPEVGEVPWTAPEGVRQGVPRVAAGGASFQMVLWPWLALLGLLGLLTEWMLFGRQPVIAAAVTYADSGGAGIEAAPQEVRL